MPWEIGLTEAHHALAARRTCADRVVLQTDGGLKTGRDIAMAAALGADEYGFGTGGARRSRLRDGAAVPRQHLPGRHRHPARGPASGVRGDRRHAGGLPEADRRRGARDPGVARPDRRLDDLVGRADLLRARAEDAVARADAPGIVLDRLLESAGNDDAQSRSAGDGRCRPQTRQSLAVRARAVADRAARWRAANCHHERRSANTDRTFGADIAGVIAARHGDAGLPDGSVSMTLTGSAGQSFGAFSLPGMRLSLTGDANDGLGKGMHGGEIVVLRRARERGRPNQVLAGQCGALRRHRRPRLHRRPGRRALRGPQQRRDRCRRRASAITRAIHDRRNRGGAWARLAATSDPA